MPIERSFAKIIVVLALAVAGAPDWARSYHIAEFNSTIHVDKNGRALVTERISFVFNGQFQGIYRDIPVEYPGPRGTNYSLFITVKKVTDEDGAALKYEEHTQGGFLHLKVFVPGAVNATRTVTIDYSAPNATKFFEDHDEF